MPFLNIPIKSISLETVSVNPTETMSWVYPSVPPANPPLTFQKAFRWRVEMKLPGDLLLPQTQSSSYTRNPGQYNCLDINVGMWISDINTGNAWQIIEVDSKTTTTITVIIQDIYRYNTFKDRTGQGNGSPPVGNYIAFELGLNGLPAIDIDTSLSTIFTQNISGRFDYINLQYDYPLYQAGNSFGINDVLAVDPISHTYVLASPVHKIAVGRVTSVSDTISGWFTINPVQKVVDNLDYLPGNIGDTIYSSNTEPDGVTTTPGGAPVYIKLRNNTQTTSISTDTGPTVPGNQFELNQTIITVNGSGNTTDLLTAVNSASSNTGVSANTVFAPTIANSNVGDTKYSFVFLYVDSLSYATSTINGTLVTFDIGITDQGVTFALSEQMATSINNSNVPDIVATAVGDNLLLTNTAGGSIDIVNLTADIDGMFFAGPASGTGLPLSTPASGNSYILFTAIDARPIDFLNITGNPVGDFGLISTENGVKAAGLYIEQGLRTPSTSVVIDLAARDALSPIIGDQAYVIDSNDGMGNNVGLWSMWLYDGAAWVATQYEQSVDSSAKTLSLSLDSTTIASNSTIGTISTGTRVSQIIVEVTTAFDGNPTLDIGYTVSDGANTETSNTGLMSNDLIDLSTVGTYTTTSDTLFGTDTITGDVVIKTEQNFAGSNTGTVQILVSYV